MSTHNFDTLRGVVLDASRSSLWSDTVKEWQVTGVEEEPQMSGICVCGKTNLRYLFTIFNHETSNTLFPIGSQCVNLFEVEELKLSVNVLRELFELRSTFAQARTVRLTAEHFSRALLADLWENGAFPGNEFNRGNGANDYKFLLDMFNQRHPFTDAEGRKVWVLINRTIRDFVLTDPRLG